MMKPTVEGGLQQRQSGPGPAPQDAEGCIPPGARDAASSRWAWVQPWSTAQPPPTWGFK